MANFIIGLFLLVTTILRPLHAEEAVQRDARVTDATGTVTLKTADNPEQAVALDEETPLAEDDILETGPKSTAEITIDADTVLKLQAGSRLQIKKLFLKNTQLELERGGILAKIKPAATPEQGLILKMPTAVVAIRGTELGAHTADKVSHIAVFDEGRVVVAGAWGHEHVILGPHQETKVTLSNVPRSPYKLAHFRPYRNQMTRLRLRPAYWHKNWKPLSAWKKREIRQNLSNPRRKKSAGFRRPVEPRKAPAKIRKASHKPRHSPAHRPKRRKA